MYIPSQWISTFMYCYMYILTKIVFFSSIISNTNHVFIFIKAHFLNCFFFSISITLYQLNPINCQNINICLKYLPIYGRIDISVKYVQIVQDNFNENQFRQSNFYSISPVNKLIVTPCFLLEDSDPDLFIKLQCLINSCHI